MIFPLHNGSSNTESNIFNVNPVIVKADPTALWHPATMIPNISTSPFLDVILLSVPYLSMYISPWLYTLSIFAFPSE